MPLASLPMLIAASPALVAMLLIPLVSAAPQAVAARTVAAYVCYRAAESRTPSVRQVQTRLRIPIASRRPFALSIATGRRAIVEALRPDRAIALVALFLPFPNAPRAP